MTATVTHPNLRPRQLAEIARLRPSVVTGPFLVPGSRSRKPAWTVTARGDDWARSVNFGHDEAQAIAGAAYLRGDR